jgi:argininosuccinate lyase
MKRLWETNEPPDRAIEAYTVGRDPELDAVLLPYEVYGTLAHAAGLVRAGVLGAAELAALQQALSALLEKRDTFTIAPEQEDIHTAVEQHLTRELGELGAKVHAGRSRNDQVQVDLRLFLKDRVLHLADASCAAGAAWLDFAERWQTTLVPGYTHLQRAMPSTLGHWAASHVEALLENTRGLQHAHDTADASPLGSAAGYGVTLPIDREMVARRLGFARVQRNTLRVQTSRPHVEATVLAALALLGRDLGVLAADLSLYCTAEFGYLTLDPAFCTGSSIMPQKRNPDVVELTRGRAALFPGWLHQVLAVGQLPSGYHRDFQCTKEPLMRAVATAAEMLDVVRRLPAALRVDAERCRQAVRSDLLATHDALQLVRDGVPFREAYRRVADRVRTAAPEPVASPPLPEALGAPGNPGFAELRAELAGRTRWCRDTRAALHAAWQALLVVTP